MKYQEFKYVEVAVNGANNRNNVCNIHAVKNFVGHKESYMTYFRYDEEMIEHFNQKQSVSGFKGQAFADWLPIDIDAQDLQQAQDQVIRLIENMEDNGIDPNACRYYFSGSKGFHVMIPSSYFDATPSSDIHKRFRKVATEIGQGLNIDTSIYNITRIFRLPNTINAKSGLFKIELYPFQVTNVDISDILEMAKQPGERLEIETEIDVSDELKKVYEAPLQSMTSSNKKTSGVDTYICMMKIMEKGVGSGERDNTALRVMAHLKRSGLNTEMIWDAFATWNNRNDPPLDTDELERLYRQGLGDYTFGCHDFVMKKHCDSKCRFFKTEWGRY